MIKAWILLGVLVACAGAVYIVSAGTTAREDYCALACTDARKCSIAIPDQCEEHCERGHRAIDLPRTCEALEQNINKAGYLW